MPQRFCAIFEDFFEAIFEDIYNIHWVWVFLSGWTSEFYRKKFTYSIPIVSFLLLEYFPMVFTLCLFYTHSIEGLWQVGLSFTIFCGCWMDNSEVRTPHDVRRSESPHCLLSLPLWTFYSWLIYSLSFPVVTYGSESWTIKKAEYQRTDGFQLWCWRRHLRESLGQQGDQSSQL